MRREILPGYELDDDRDRIDVAAVHRFLSEQAYWALGRPYDTVALLVRNSYHVLGLYHDGALVGYCRAVSDGVVHAYLADVYVLEEHRGKGLGRRWCERWSIPASWPTPAGCSTPATCSRCTESSVSEHPASGPWNARPAESAQRRRILPLWAFTIFEPLASREATRPRELALLPVLTTTIPFVNVRVMVVPLTFILAVGLPSWPARLKKSHHLPAC
jgi:GNAT superfamily N-acetyltransferase